MPSDTPILIEPSEEYLGVVCRNCQHFVPVVGPLDPVEIPPDKPMRVGSRGPLRVECPNCKHQADYPVNELRRGRITKD